MPTQAIERVQGRIQKLPDPTILFLALTGIILSIKAWREELLRTWPARLVFPPLLLFSVFAASLWRRPTAKRKNDDAATPAPGIVPNPRKLVAHGEMLRKKDANVTKSERELRKAQLKLEMLRKDITQRLPSNSTINSERERNVTDDSAVRRQNVSIDDTVQIPF